MKKVAFVVGIVLVIGALLYVGMHMYLNGSTPFTNTAAVAPTITDASTTDSSEPVNTIVDVPTEPVPELTKTYTNRTYRFTVKMPKDFTSRELAPDQHKARTIVLEDIDGTGVQIYITPDPDKHTILTADDVRGAIPDMKVVGEQDVTIGDDGKGVAFKSDNEAFGKNSREVWFYFHGNLYQISTYARFDPLLKAMFGTWQFF